MGLTLRKTAAIALGATLFFAMAAPAKEAPPGAADSVPIARAVPGGATQKADSRDSKKQGAASRSERNAGAKTSSNRAANQATDGAYIEALANGGYEVTWPGGCVARYDKQGRPSYYSEPCDEPTADESQQIVDSYRR